MAHSNPDATAVVLITAAFIDMLAEAAEWRTMEAQQQMLLLALYDKGEIDQRDLVKFTHVSTSSNNRNIARMGTGARPVRGPDGEAKERQPGLGWIESYRDPNDNRFTKVRLTQLGRAEVDRIAQKVAQILQHRRHAHERDSVS